MTHFIGEESSWGAPRFVENIFSLQHEVGTCRERGEALQEKFNQLSKQVPRWSTRSGPKRQYRNGERGRNTPSIALCNKYGPQLIYYISSEKYIMKL